jgi:hypothetical protein
MGKDLSSSQENRTSEPSPEGLSIPKLFAMGAVPVPEGPILKQIIVLAFCALPPS